MCSASFPPCGTSRLDLLGTIPFWFSFGKSCGCFLLVLPQSRFRAGWADTKSETLQTTGCLERIVTCATQRSFVLLPSAVLLKQSLPPRCDKQPHAENQEQHSFHILHCSAVCVALEMKSQQFHGVAMATSRLRWSAVAKEIEKSTRYQKWAELSRALRCSGNEAHVCLNLD